MGAGGADELIEAFKRSSWKIWVEEVEGVDPIYPEKTWEGRHVSKIRYTIVNTLRLHSE